MRTTHSNHGASWRKDRSLERNDSPLLNHAIDTPGALRNRISAPPTSAFVPYRTRITGITYSIPHGYHTILSRAVSIFALCFLSSAITHQLSCNDFAIGSCVPRSTEPLHKTGREPIPYHPAHRAARSSARPKSLMNSVVSMNIPQTIHEQFSSQSHKRTTMLKKMHFAFNQS
ncbi:MAG: hypothetical protein FD149_547 [Rhodospirillaceae bacterium]|nr:MAG: hypothetical protein FD149_547 [Rhodospirillaceae bacterium]